MEYYVNFITTIFFLCLVRNAVGICMPEHPQTTVCRAKFVLCQKCGGCTVSQEGCCSSQGIHLSAQVRKLAVIRAKIINIETRQFPWEKKSHAAGMRIPLIGGGLAAPASSGGRMAAPAASTGGGFAPASSSGSPGYGFPRPQVIKATISRVYKGYKVVNASKGETVEIEYSSPYRMPLKSGRLYLLTGYNVDGKLYTSMCNWYSLWRDVTVTQKFGLKFYYWIYCACKIQFCPDGRCIRNRRLCTWDLRRFDIGAAKRDCHSQFNICMVKPSIGRCLWISPKGGKRCEKTSKPLIKPSKPVIP